MPSCDLSIPGYSFLRRDSKANNEIALIVYISDILSYKHLSHLDQPGMEAILVDFCYRNPASRIDWIHTTMMDNVVFERKETILLGDFNIGLQK